MINEETLSGTYPEIDPNAYKLVSVEEAVKAYLADKDVSAWLLNLESGEMNPIQDVTLLEFDPTTCIVMMEKEDV